MNLIVNTFSQACQSILSEEWCPEQKQDSETTTILKVAGFALITFLIIRRTCVGSSRKKQDYLSYIRNPELLKTLPTAKDGNIAVYLGDRFVIKDFNDTKAKGPIISKAERIKNKCLALQIINTQKLEHLVVPRIFPLKENPRFLVEQKLPILQSGSKAEELYEHNRELFTDAVKEFTQLVMRGNFDDFLKWNYLAAILKTPKPRYDNVCPYIENGEGKLGLVDLENFERWNCFPSRDFGNKIKYCNMETAEKLIHLFPLHMDEILEEMQEKGFDFKVEDRLRLQELSDEQWAQRHSNTLATK